MIEAWRLAVVSTHPIQYHTPWFQAMHQHPLIELTVFYGHAATRQDQSEAGFGVEFEWDIPLLEGYEYCFLKNVAKKPSLDFWGIDTPEIRGVIERGRFDAVLVHGWHYKGAWQTLRACWSTRTPAWVRGDSQLVGPRSWSRRAIKALPYRWFIRRLQACLCVGQRSRDYFLHYGAAPERIFEVPHVLGDRWYSPLPSQEERTRLRAGYNLGREALVILFVGKLESKKRPWDLLRALAKMSNPRTVGLIVGEGDQRGRCEKIAASSGVQAKFLGFVNQARLPEIYSLSDVLVLPSDGRETWGLVVNEAMSRGLPCVVSNEVGSAPDLVIDGETGAVFQCGDPNSLAENLIRVVSDSREVAGMGRRSRHLIEHYRPMAAVDGILKAFQSLRMRHRS